MIFATFLFLTLRLVLQTADAAPLDTISALNASSASVLHIFVHKHQADDAAVQASRPKLRQRRTNSVSFSALLSVRQPNGT